MDQSLAPHFYPSNAMVDYVSLPSSSVSSGPFFPTALPSIINIDPLNSCSSGSAYNLPFAPTSATLSSDIITNDSDDIWRGSSIASLRRKAVEYQAGSNNNYK
jgi:hypothetical protein